MRIVRSAAFAALTLTLASTILHAQTRGTGNVFAISGRIVVPVANFNGMIEVFLLQHAEQIVAQTFADSSGRYRFAGLGRGSYFVVVKLGGFEDVRQRIDVGVGGAENIVNIILDFKEERIVERPLDLSGEDSEVIDIADLTREYPARLVRQYREAEEDLRKGNMSLAEVALESIVAEAPDFYFAHKALGSLYQKLARYRDAEAAYKQAHDLRPNSASPLMHLGSLYIQEVDASANRGTAVVRQILDQALDNLEMAVKLNPNASFAYYLLGIGYYKSAFYEDAEDNLKRALELEPRLGHAHLALANVYIRIQEWSDAVNQLDAYLKENPEAEGRSQIEATRAKIAQRASAGAIPSK